ncbi:MAG: formate dehydrogenase, partial [Alphaproteobacteria bacterium]|nr:formate dehydrogenase [Alphaproteobacteria bacterium]
GKCTPCRIGAQRGRELIDHIRHRKLMAQAAGIEADIILLRDLCNTMKSSSLCALGGFTPYPVLSALEHWPEDFGG